MKTYTIPIQKNTNITFIGTTEIPARRALYKVASDTMLYSRGTVVYLSSIIDDYKPKEEFDRLYGLDVLPRIVFHSSSPFYMLFSLTVHELKSEPETYEIIGLEDNEAFIPDDGELQPNYVASQFFELEHEMAFIGGLESVSTVVFDPGRFNWGKFTTHNFENWYSNSASANIEAMIRFAKKHGISIVTAFPEHVLDELIPVIEEVARQHGPEDQIE